ncbi:MAG: ribonuclease H-like domain-containing protein [Acidobacteria bacterium]|nr:ribonuclease H-like domain-containing protein [Acidobacteriota bacterium]
MVDLSRLREIMKGTGGNSVAPRPELTDEPLAGAGQRASGDLCAELGGVSVETSTGACVVIEREYDADRFHGRIRVSDCRVDPAVHASALNLLIRSSTDQPVPSAGGPVVFLDLETTGLTGGAGMCAFLVGCAMFEDGCFRTRQVFLPAFSAERALLSLAAEWLGRASMIVTYNGKSFDVPVMETRWLFHRMPVALEGKRHLDMLHPARSLWKARAPDVDEEWGRRNERASCRLTALERSLLGLSRVGDVPGFEIPSRYFSYVRSGDPSPLAPVVEHNRLDLISLAAVTARALRLVSDGPDQAEDARECLALGRIYDRGGLTSQAIDCYVRAAEMASHARGTGAWDRDDGSIESEALCRFARWARRERRFGEAAAAWRRVLKLPARPMNFEREAIEALAIHHEHRERDLPLAHTFASRALDAQAGPRGRDSVRHRLTRLERKLGAVHEKSGAAAAFFK